MHFRYVYFFLSTIWKTACEREEVWFADVVPEVLDNNKQASNRATPTRHWPALISDLDELQHITNTMHRFLLKAHHLKKCGGHICLKKVDKSSEAKCYLPAPVAWHLQEPATSFSYWEGRTAVVTWWCRAIITFIIHSLKKSEVNHHGSPPT